MRLLACADPRAPAAGRALAPDLSLTTGAVNDLPLTKR